MLNFYKFLTILLLISFFEPISAQNNRDFQVGSGLNGQTYLVSQQNTGNRILVEAYFRTGPLYESDSLNGISKLVTTVIDQRVQNTLHKTGSDIRYFSKVYSDQIYFNLEGSLPQLDQILQLIRDQICDGKFTDDGVTEAIEIMKAEHDSAMAMPGAAALREAGANLWQKDYNRMTPWGNHKTFQNLGRNECALFFSKYFLPLNSCIAITGNINPESTLNKVTEYFKNFSSTSFNPEQIVQVIQFKPVVNYVQLLDNSNPAAQNKASLFFQNPGARQDRNGTYAAFILAQVINDQNGVFQQRLKGTPFYNLQAQYNCENFFGTFTISINSTGKDFVEEFHFLEDILKTVSINSFWKEGDIEVAARNIRNEIASYRQSNPHWFLQQVARYRFANDERYFSSLSDSLLRVSSPSINRYINDYFINRSGIRLLETTAGALRNNLPEQQYFPLDASIADMEFHYDQNKTDLEGDSNNQNLLRLIQWLKINPDNHVQVNGFSDESEFKRADDKYIMRFLDSMPSFKKVMPETIKKGYLRIEMMRAVKIVKLLYEAGIEERRLNGTSMVFSSDDDEQAAKNRKCSITIEKIKPRTSLYEYHFGKPKE
ncbi:MAG: insulinase family protein [Chitinophagales bacterium]